LRLKLVRAPIWAPNGGVIVTTDARGLGAPAPAGRRRQRRRAVGWRVAECMRSSIFLTLPRTIFTDWRTSSIAWLWRPATTFTVLLFSYIVFQAISILLKQVENKIETAAIDARLIVQGRLLTIEGRLSGIEAKLDRIERVLNR
jgi:hypothetical protein